MRSSPTGFHRTQQAAPFIEALCFNMAKCLSCGAKIKLDYPRLFGSTVLSEFGFQLSMTILGGYVTACIYTFKSTTAIVVASLVGGLIFYLLQRNTQKICSLCTLKNLKPNK